MRAEDRKAYLDLVSKAVQRVNEVLKVVPDPAKPLSVRTATPLPVAPPSTHNEIIRKTKEICASLDSVQARISPA